jgi:hypothetical protein
MSAPEAAGVILNILAFLGAGLFLSFHADDRRNSPVETRLTATITLLMGLIGVRTVRWALDLDMLRRLEEALAAAMPLAALIVAEGLMRRHAPAWMKRVFLGGAVLFAALALLRPASLNSFTVISLGSFVAGGLAAVALLLALRDRRELAPAENAAISALGLGLVVALPFVASDFRFAAGLSPVRAGGLALLIFIYAAVRLAVAGAGGRAVLVDLAIALFGAGGAFVTFVAVMGMPDAATALAFLAVILGLVHVILIVQGLREREAAFARLSLIAALAEAPARPLDAFIDRLLGAPALERAVLLEGPALADYDGAILRESLAALPAASLSEARGLGPGGAALAALIEAHEGTHGVLVSEEPLRVLVVNMPALSAGPEVSLQLTLLHKLAAGAAR